MGNPNLQPGIVPFDLSRNGSLFGFHGKANVNQYAFYFSDTIKIGKLTVTPGLRIDHYDGLSQATAAQPRIGLAYLITPKTVLRMAYARTFETPYNENLILSSGTGAGGLAQNVFGSNSVPLQPGRRNQYNVGLQAEPGSLGHRRRGLFLEVHAQCLRFQRAIQHADHVSDRLAAIEVGRCDGACQHHKHPWVHGLHDARPLAGHDISRPKPAGWCRSADSRAAYSASITIRRISRPW